MSNRTRLVGLSVGLLCTIGVALWAPDAIGHLLGVAFAVCMAAGIAITIARR
jgi:hypothetical protein